jgi:integrase/recombinase XerD
MEPLYQKRISEAVPAFDLGDKINACISSERVRNLSERSLKELNHQLTRFNAFCRERSVKDIFQCTASFLKDFILYSNPSASPTQGKTIVWCLRKLFRYLMLWGDITENPAAVLSHPKMSRRSKLPDYLPASDLRTLMEWVSEHGTLQDMTILSLLATVGARPIEICKLRRRDIDYGSRCIFLSVKGNWYKRTPVSSAMAELLEEYVATGTHRSSVLFLNQWNRPVDTRYIQRMLKHFAGEAGLPYTITPNTLRHTFATFAADRHGVVITRALLGHCAQSHATDVYMHLAPSKYRPLMNCHPYQTTIGRGRK